MRIDIFKLPIYIDNIDCKKINLTNVDFKKTWLSKTESSYNFKNYLSEESAKYLLTKIANLISGNIKKSFRLNLINIWQNNYKSFDYQEKHIHTQSYFSFIIYKDIDESKTVFFNPANNLLQAFYNPSFLENSNFFNLEFEPKCAKNQIIVFPSFLEHMVKKHDNSVTISGNINIIHEE
tara:strand:- start:193 stop:729 length:537 start_codon:yes stop_codon:yes gene_type:complete